MADTPLVAGPLDRGPSRLALWFPFVAAGLGGVLLLSALAHLRAAAGSGGAAPPAAAWGRLALAAATAGVALCLVALWARRRHPPQGLLQAVLAVALTAAALDALATVQLAGSPDRLVDAGLATVAAGAVVPGRRWSLAVVATISVCWIATAASAGPIRGYEAVALLVAVAGAVTARELRRPAGRRRLEP